MDSRSPRLVLVEDDVRHGPLLVEVLADRVVGSDGGGAIDGRDSVHTVHGLGYRLGLS